MAAEVFEKIYEKPGKAIWTFEEPPKTLVELVENDVIRPSKTIDLGCGEGFYSIYLASNGFDVLGVDISARAINYATINARQKNTNVRFQKHDVLEENTLGENFELSFEWALLHHIAFEYREKYVEKVSRMLIPKAKYVSASFDIDSPNYIGSNNRIRPTPFGTTLYHSTIDELVTLFSPFFNILEKRQIEMFGKGIKHLANLLIMEKRDKKVSDF